MPDAVLLAKAATLERCVARIQSVYAATPAHLHNDLLRQEAILLNLQRACQTAIDAAMYLVRRDGLGFPQGSREAFRLLVTADRLTARLGAALEGMVGFRNVAVHDYRTLDLAVVQGIVETRLGDFEAFAAVLVAAA